MLAALPTSILGADGSARARRVVGVRERDGPPALLLSIAYAAV